MNPHEEWVYDNRADREFDALFSILRANPHINPRVAANTAADAVEALTLLQEKRKNG